MAAPEYDKILDAVKCNNTSEIQKYLELGGDPNRLLTIPDDDKVLPLLSCACKWGRFGIVQLLLDSGSDINIPSSDAKTAMHFTCEGTDMRDEVKLELLEILHLLIQKGADCNSSDNMGSTPLFFACEADDINMVKLLLNSGCNVNVRTMCGDSALKVACRNAKFWSYWHGRVNSTARTVNPQTFPSIQITKLLLQHNADVTGATLMPTAVQFGDPQLVREFLDLGMDVNMLDENQFTPLGAACTTACVSCDIVRMLLDHGAEVNKGGGWTKQKPLIFAYVHNSVNKIRLLLSYGARITPGEITDLISLSFSKSILENPEVVGPNSKELLSWRLLLAAGFKPVVQGTQLACKIQQLSICSSYDKISPWIFSLLFPIYSLKEICRITIRNSMNPSIDEKIKTLCLPDKLKDFLMFKEFSFLEHHI